MFVSTIIISKLFKDIDEQVKLYKKEEEVKQNRLLKIQEMHRKRMVSDNVSVSEVNAHKEVITDLLREREKGSSPDVYYDRRASYDMSIELNDAGKAMRYKDGNGVEGIVEGREYNNIDKNKDGRILVSEFYPLTEEEVLERILLVDSNFSKMQFKSFVRGIFMLIQKAWSNNDYRSLRSFEADSLYYEHKLRIEDLITNNIYDKRENIGIKGVLLKDFRVEGDKEILVVALTARMDRNFSGDVFRSKENAFYENNRNLNRRSGNVPYIMTFMRNKGVKTKERIALSTTNCCNCGAVIKVDDNGVCRYCNTSLVTGEVDWVLVDIKNIELVEF